MANTEQKTCQVVMVHVIEPCGRPLYDGEKCICHSKKENKDVKLFQKELDKIFGDDEAEYHDLTRFFFPKKGYKLLEEYKKDTFLTEATFSGKALFWGATFLGNASFRYATFSGEADFGDTAFSGDADFFGAKFSGEADFSCAKFSGEADFVQASFSGGAFFFGATFSGGANFDSATFSGVASFWQATLSGGANFDYATFSRKANFGEVKFSGNAMFDLTMFNESVVFSLCSFADPQGIKFRKVSLEKSKFLETDVTEVQFVDVAWAKRSKFFKWFPRKAVHDEFSEEPDYSLIAQLYRRLQQNYINNYRYSEAGDFYIGEQEMVRKAKGKMGQYLSTNNAYRIISYYGESFLLPLFWLAFVLLLLPAILLWDGVNLNPYGKDPASAEVVNYDWDRSADFLLTDSEFLSDYWEAFVANFSLIAYSRSDIGKYLLESHSRLIVTIESLIVIALVAFFLLALRRQYKRKTF